MMNPPPVLQAVTFDVGGTLIDPWPSVGHIYAQVAGEHGHGHADPAVLNRRFAEAWRAKSDFDYSRAAWSELVFRAFHGPAEPFQELGFFTKLYERFAQPEAWRIYEDVLPTLMNLTQRGLKLAAISNWDERLRPLLARLKLDRYFDFIAISAEIGVRKPGREIFDAALRRFDLPAASVLHVGDSTLEDVQGARTAGLQAVRLYRDAASSVEGGRIQSLVDLTVLLERPRKGREPV